MERDKVTLEDGPRNEPLYLSHYKVSVDGDWLCLKEVEQSRDPRHQPQNKPSVMPHSKACPSSLQPSLDQSARKHKDSCVVERSNLINILKLVVQEIIDSSLSLGCQLDSDHVPLKHFFIVMEHILRHGLKGSKSFLGTKRNLWEMLQTLKVRRPEDADIIVNVRNLPNVRTVWGRVRAWLQLALMQKKLPDLLGTLVEEQSILLSDYYEHFALLRSEEAALVIGLLSTLNVVDCNLCIKEEDLDSDPGIIDFSLYLKSKKDLAATPRRCDNQLDDGDSTSTSLSTAMDQKSYVEEMNRKLSSTIATLEKKVQNLQTTNTLLKEDLAINEKKLRKTETEKNELARNQMNQRRLTGPADHRVSDSSADKALEKEMVALKKELSLQVSMKAEMEMAMKLLEKDVHEKQDTIISLRDQLDEIKTINMDMYSKLKECESELSQKGEVVARLEAKTQDISRLLLRMNKECEHLLKLKTDAILQLEDKCSTDVDVDKIHDRHGAQFREEVYHLERTLLCLRDLLRATTENCSD